MSSTHASFDYLQGSFAFVVYDAVTRRVWAARDAAGVQPLFWGVTGMFWQVLATSVSRQRHLVVPNCCTL